MYYIIIFSSVAFSAVWFVTLLVNIDILCKIPIFENESTELPSCWPKLSVVVTACNEASTIGPAINSILVQDYPDLEIILVNDRSSDSTGEVIAGVSKKDSRIVPLNITRLPEKWLGKVHALYIASKKVSGEWVLYTDADVCFEEGVFKKSVALALQKKYDHITLIPGIYTNSFWFEVLLKTFGAFLLHGTRRLKFCGIGAFNLVKKSAFDKTEGFKWLRMEVADDMGLGLMLYRSGAKSFFALALKDIHLTWYSSIAGMVQGLEKNMFSIVKYRLTKLVILFLFLWGLALGPFYLLAFPPTPIFFYLGLSGYVLFFVNAVIGKIRFGENLAPSLFIQAGLIMLSLILLRAGILCKLRGGIKWRGTFYKLKDLISGQRLL